MYVYVCVRVGVGVCLEERESERGLRSYLASRFFIIKISFFDGFNEVTKSKFRCMKFGGKMPQQRQSDFYNK